MISKDSKRSVYLYQRFSSVGQEGNSSLYRQGAAQRDWLLEHPLCEVVELEDTPLVDSGVSAYSGKHLESGSLGRLVKAIEGNLVQKGSIILVEHFSRLSRMNQTETGRLLDKIWDKDITIVTARDRGVYSPEMREDLATRLRLIVEIDKAHSDSKWRSDKVRSSWSRREKEAKESGIPPKMKMPFWLNREGQLNEYAEVVRDIFTLHASGLGQVIIERKLRKKYGDIKPLVNVNPTKIIRIIQNEKCIGIVFGRKLFQPVVDDDTFYNAQRICKERLFTSVREDRKWPLHGLVKCGSCGSGMSIQQSAGSLPLLRCSKKQRSGGDYCDAPSTFPYVVAYHFFLYYVEPVFLSHMSDTKSNHDAEKRKLEIDYKLRNLYSSFKEAEDLYKKRRSAGQQASLALGVMDDINDEIDELTLELTDLQAQIKISKNLASISKEILELSLSDSSQYNLELNRLGLKIWIRHNELYFSLEGDKKIGSLQYLKYDRKLLAYPYKFKGDSDFYKVVKHSGKVKSQDWSIERLLNPRKSFDSSPKQLARMFDEIYKYSNHIPIFGKESDFPKPFFDLSKKKIK